MLQFVIAGLVLGGIYAIASAGLVITYTSSGILNFAFGAIAFFIARFYYYLHTQESWAIVPSAVVSIVITAPALGVFLYVVLFRHLRLSSPLIKVVATIGLLVAIPSVATLIFGNQAIQQAPGLAPEPVRVFDFLGVPVTMDQVIVYACVVATVLIGAGVLRYTEIGLKVRAMVDSPAMTDLSGTNPTAIAVGVWAVATFFAGLTGVLAAPIIGLDSGNFTLLIAASFAAVVAARLRSLPIAVGRRPAHGCRDVALPAVPPAGQPVDDRDHRRDPLHGDRAVPDLQPGTPRQGGGVGRMGRRTRPRHHATGREPTGGVDQQPGRDRVHGFPREVRRPASAHRRGRGDPPDCPGLLGGTLRPGLRVRHHFPLLDHRHGRGRHALALPDHLRRRGRVDHGSAGQQPRLAGARGGARRRARRGGHGSHRWLSQHQAGRPLRGSRHADFRSPHGELGLHPAFVRQPGPRVEPQPARIRVLGPVVHVSLPGCVRGAVPVHRELPTLHDRSGSQRRSME